MIRVAQKSKGQTRPFSGTNKVVPS